MKLYEQSEADISARLDARIEQSGDFGVYGFSWGDNYDPNNRPGRGSQSVPLPGIVCRVRACTHPID